MKRLIYVLAALFLVSCAQTPPPAPVAKLKDGELAVPANYRSWKSTPLSIQRADVKQIREVYVNDVAAGATKGGKFPNGTVAVMEIYAAKAGADGVPERGPDGNLVKGNLAKIFVMGKNEGWGDDPADTPKNGQWIYGAFTADGKTKSADPITPCRTCHLNNPNIGETKDYVAVYDKYFANRK